MSNLFEDLDELGTSLKGAYNATRLKMADPSKRRGMEEEMLRKRREGEKRKRVFEGLDDGSRERDAKEAWELRKELDPNEAMRRRMEEAEGPLSNTKEGFLMQQEQVRDIVRRYQEGAPISKQEKILAFHVITEVIKGLGYEREKQLEKKFGPSAETEEPSLPA